MIDISLVSDEAGMYFIDYLKSSTENLYETVLANYNIADFSQPTNWVQSAKKLACFMKQPTGL